MGTLGGFPNPPALWLWRAKPAFAYAIMGALGRVPKPSRALALAGKARLRLRDHGSPWEGSQTLPRSGSGGQSPPSPTRSWEPLGGFASPFGPPPATPAPLAALGLAKPSRALALAGNEGAREARGVGRVGCPSRSPRRGSPPSPTRSWEPWEGSLCPSAPHPPPLPRSLRPPLPTCGR
jgi:hypothetical protein